MDPHAYSRARAAAPGSPAYYTLLSLPPERRDDAVALHAWVQEIRAIADEVRDPGVARTKLVWWRDELARTFAGNPQHPVARAMARVIERHRIERADLEDVVQGAAMDLEYNAYPDRDALSVYCRRMGGVVQQQLAKVYGYSDARTLEHAEALGFAHELTRIVRDVGHDARHGRVYLPLHDMAAHGVTSEDLIHARESDNLGRLIGAQIARANEHFDRALALLPPADRKSQRPGLVQAAIDRALLKEIQADGCRVLTHRTALTPLRMAWIAWRTR